MNYEKMCDVPCKECYDRLKTAYTTAERKRKLHWNKLLAVQKEAKVKAKALQEADVTIMTLKGTISKWSATRNNQARYDGTRIKELECQVRAQNLEIKRLTDKMIEAYFNGLEFSDKLSEDRLRLSARMSAKALKEGLSLP